MTKLKAEPLTRDLSSYPTRVIHTAYSPKQRLTVSFPAEGRTKQSFKAECDINTIMSQYARTGVFTHLSQRAPQYLDIQDIDFQGAMQVVADAREQFAALPSELRDRFSNDPGRLLAFLQDPANRAEAERLGLLRAPDHPAFKPQSATAPDLKPQAAPLASSAADAPKAA